MDQRACEEPEEPGAREEVGRGGGGKGGEVEERVMGVRARSVASWTHLRGREGDVKGKVLGQSVQRKVFQ